MDQQRTPSLSRPWSSILRNSATLATFCRLTCLMIAPFAQPGHLGHAARLDFGDHHARLLLDTQMLGHVGGEVLDGEPQLVEAGRARRRPSRFPRRRGDRPPRRSSWAGPAGSGPPGLIVRSPHPHPARRPSFVAVTAQDRAGDFGGRADGLLFHQAWCSCQGLLTLWPANSSTTTRARQRLGV